MIDREKAIKALECCCELNDFDKPNCKDCPAECMTDGYMSIPFIKDVLALLKEQEAVKPKTGHWIFESAYCEAWSHTCSECGKRMTTAYNTYANYCWNCGAKMEGR